MFKKTLNILKIKDFWSTTNSNLHCIFNKIQSNLFFTTVCLYIFPLKTKLSAKILYKKIGQTFKENAVEKRM